MQPATTFTVNGAVEAVITLLLVVMTPVNLTVYTPTSAEELVNKLKVLVSGSKLNNPALAGEISAE